MTLRDTELCLDTPSVNYLTVKCNFMRQIEVALRIYQRSHKIPIPVSAQNQPTRIENRPKTTNRLYFFPGPLIYKAVQSRSLITRHHSYGFIHQTQQPDTKSRFPTTRRHSHGFISPEIKATILYHQTPPPRYRSPDNTVIFSFTRYQSHCCISPDATAMVLFTSRYHSPDATAMVSITSRYQSPDTIATVSFTRRHSHGFIHQTPQPWFHSPDTTVTASFT